jgi:peptidoglycan LD-endopeptidase LytH
MGRPRNLLVWTVVLASLVTSCSRPNTSARPRSARRTAAPGSRTTLGSDGGGGGDRGSTVPPSLVTSAPPTSPSPEAPGYVFPLDPSSVAHYVDGHHDYPATDIFAPIGTRFVAVTSGVIDAVSREDHWDPAVNDGATRGGLYVSLIGDDGVRYYGSHLSWVAPGIRPGLRVEKGRLLGRVGQTGDARGISPHLHFGISHPTTPDDWEIRRGEIDPYPYLKAWTRGEDLRPELPGA